MYVMEKMVAARQPDARSKRLAALASPPGHACSIARPLMASDQRQSPAWPWWIHFYMLGSAVYISAASYERISFI